MPVAHFYHRSLFPFLGVAVPEPLVQLGAFIGDRAQHMSDAYDRFFLDHCENIARRLADIALYKRAIDYELASTGNPFQSATFVQTYLVAYLGAVKSLLDAIAICLDCLYSLHLKPIDRDLCRDRLLASLYKVDALAADRYHGHQVFYEDVRVWRNAAQHQVAPIVMVCGPTSARAGRAPDQIPRNEVNIRLVNKPGLLPSHLSRQSNDIPWVGPDAFFSSWSDSVEHIVTSICGDIMAHCPPS